MPTYDYRCKKCGHEFETVQRITEEPLTECPKCDGEIRRVITNGNFVRKGNNWERDGYTGGREGV